MQRPKENLVPVVIAAFQPTVDVFVIVNNSAFIDENNMCTVWRFNV